MRERGLKLSLGTASHPGRVAPHAGAWIETITDIRHQLDFSYKLCQCCRNLQLEGSTFNQKGMRMDGS